MLERGSHGNFSHSASNPVLARLEPGRPRSLRQAGSHWFMQSCSRLAHYYMSGQNAGHTLQTTALVNEAYLRLVDLNQVSWQNRAHFFAVSARLMRRILIDFARSRNYLKRGGGAQQVALDEAMLISEEPDFDLVLLDEALNALAEIDARKSQVVELRFFGGMTEEETAQFLSVSPETVRRDLRLAKAWLLREIEEA